MMFETSKHVPKTEKRRCVFKDKTLKHVTRSKYLNPQMYLIPAYSVLINKGRNVNFLFIFDHMSLRGITGAGFSC